VVEHVLICFWIRDPSISLEPVMQGNTEEPTEAARVGVEDVACTIAEQFKREPEDV
jgi:hypothetical protein